MKKLIFCSIVALVIFPVMLICDSFAGDQAFGPWNARTCSIKGSIVPNPKVIGPIPSPDRPGDFSRNYPWLSRADDLLLLGYIEEEFFIEGTARRYDTSDPLKDAKLTDPGWYPYKTRIIVRRPISPDHFNGIVLFEWQNVGQGWDLEPMWSSLWQQFVQAGYAWVGVDAEKNGIHNPSTGLKVWSPIRYGSLDVTVKGTINDDSLMHDIFSQCAQAVRCPVGVDPMGGLQVKMVLNGGASSGGAPKLYCNTVQPLHNVIDGFYFVRCGGGPIFRTDLKTKVFQHFSEKEVINYLNRTIPNSDSYRLWQVAGSCHYTYHDLMNITAVRARDGIAPGDIRLACPNPLTRIPDRYVGMAAIDHLVRWVKDGTPPPIAPPIEVLSVGPPAIIARDSYGNALGGIRLPPFAVPTALSSGATAGPSACANYGTYIPFDDATLRALYPTHQAYVDAFNQSVEENLKAGYILKEAAREMMEEAAKANIPPK